MQHTIQTAFSSTLLTHIYPHSTVQISLHVLAQDGALLAACINAATLALVDAGVPMYDYLAACTAGSTSASATNTAAAAPGAVQEVEDPLLDLNGLEEQELPFLTVATLGACEKVSVLVMETRVHASKIEEMLAVGVDGCKRIKEMLDGVIRAHAKSVAEG